MADKKISQLTTLVQADVAPTADFLPIVDTSATETKKSTPESVVLGTLANSTANVGIGGSLGSTPSLNRGVYLQSNTNNHVIGYSLYVNDGANNRRGSMFLDDSAGLWGWDVTASSGTPAYVWRSAATEQMRLDGSGNLGIGTATPRGDLDAGTSTTTSITKSLHLGYSVADFYGFRVANTNAAGSTFAGTFAIQRGTGSAWADNVTVDDNANVTAGGGTLATSATNGFLYVPTCAGTPTGTPTAKTGYAPIVVNTTNNKLYFYSGGAWRDAGP